MASSKGQCITGYHSESAGRRTASATCKARGKRSLRIYLCHSFSPSTRVLAGICRAQQYHLTLCKSKGYVPCTTLQQCLRRRCMFHRKCWCMQTEHPQAREFSSCFDLFFWSVPETCARWRGIHFAGSFPAEMYWNAVLKVQPPSICPSLGCQWKSLEQKPFKEVNNTLK